MKYDLVFEGGGAKGMVFVGALEEFFSRGHSAGRLLGTSAGAIAAVLLAAGYGPASMLKALNEKENGQSVFAGFMGQPEPFAEEEIKESATRMVFSNIDLKFVPGFLEGPLDDALARWLAWHPRSRHFVAFVERGGWFSAARFVRWLQDKLDVDPETQLKRAYSRMTLKEFFEATRVELSVVAADTTDSRLLVLNRRTAPDCPVVWAVRMSMSIPLVWDEVVWKEAWGSYLGQPMAGHVVVDGGMLSNFPIELFISGEAPVTKLMGPKQDNPVLGLLIDETLPVPVKRGILIDVNIKPGELRTVQRIMRLVNTMTGAHDKMVIEEYEHLVVRLPAGGYGTTEFDMSDPRRESLVAAGRRAMKAYLDARPAPRGAAPRGVKAKGAKAAPRGAKGAKGVKPAPTAADRIARRLLRRKP
ncbi:MAG TPA: patatin-like phospholipase family protein [Desulfobacterales bacterium]|nr:patatin-like phospholipase family protein [Desulfobacterales bacterium]